MSKLLNLLVPLQAYPIPHCKKFVVEFPSIGAQNDEPLKAASDAGAANSARSALFELKHWESVMKKSELAPFVAAIVAIVSSGLANAKNARGTPSAKEMERLGAVYTDPGEIPQLEVEIDGKKLALPLEHTDVDARITGYVGRVRVTQTYRNPYDHPLEAIYVFPLPENSAVDDMKMKIGDRTIRAEIKEREAARRTYEAAKEKGHTAALLEQERPNVFTQSVANIAPKAKIDVEVSYLQDLTYDAGQYEFVFPMVVGPRFNPGSPTGTRSGSGWAKDTDQVPDASRISPPVLGSGERSGHDISLRVRVNAGLPVSHWDAPTHATVERPTLDGTLDLAIADTDRLPNRDFVLRYRVDSETPQATFLTHEDSRGGYFSLIVHPPKLDVEELVGRREMIFVVDVSGSMHGVPLSMCKDAMRNALRQLRPVDTFNVITFSGRTGQAFSAPRPANNTNTKEAAAFIDGLKAGGGTQMLQGVQAALSPEVGEGRHRYVFFMTDGYIGNEKAIFDGTQNLVEALDRRGQKARVFGFGVGSSVNRHLLDGIGKAGQGTTVYATTREDPTLAVNTFFRFVDHPVLSGLEIDWGDMAVSQVFPTRLPDLFASRPLVIHGRFEGKARGSVTIRAKGNGQREVIEAELDQSSKNQGGGSLATLWARSKIEDLERALWSGTNQQAIASITKLGIDYRIVTAYTSFVAVDESTRVDGRSKTIVQPVETPEGVNRLMAGAAGASLLGARSAQKGGYRSFGRGGIAMQGVGSGGGSGSAHGGFGAAFKSSRGEAEAPAKPVKRSVSEERKNDDKTPADRDASAPRIEVRSPRAQAAIHRELSRLIERLLSNHAVSGKLRLRFFLSTTGQVLQPKVSDARGIDQKFIDALLIELRQVKLPAGRGGTAAKVDVRFNL